MPPTRTPEAQRPPPPPTAADPLIDDVRAVRRDLSERYGNDPERLAASLRQVGDEYRRRIAQGPPVSGDASDAGDRLRRFAGSVNGGDPRSADNDRIDADLARAYEATHDNTGDDSHNDPPA